MLENSYNLVGKGSKHARFSKAAVDLAGKGRKHGHYIICGSDLTVFFEVRNCKHATGIEFKGCGQLIEK